MSDGRQWAEDPVVEVRGDSGPGRPGTGAHDIDTGQDQVELVQAAGDLRQWQQLFGTERTGAQQGESVRWRIDAQHGEQQIPVPAHPVSATFGQWYIEGSGTI